MNQPLAVEIIAHVCEAQALPAQPGQLRAAAEYFKTHRLSTVAQLIEALHREVLPVQLQQTAP